MNPQELTPETLIKNTKAIVDAITSPAYVDAMKKIKAAPNDRRLSAAMTALTPEKLRDQGVPLPAEMRISSRYFEAEMPAIEVGELPGGQKGLLRQLEERNPGIMDKLRAREPKLFLDLVEFDLKEPVIDPVALCVCACGGGAGFCGGAGAG